MIAALVMQVVILKLNFNRINSISDQRLIMIFNSRENDLLDALPSIEMI
jgi:hypothetical protein